MIRTRFLLLSAFFMFVHLMFGQRAVWIQTSMVDLPKSYIYELADSSLAITQTKRFYEVESGLFGVENYFIEDIEKIKIKSSAIIAGGAIIGFCVGGAIGITNTQKSKDLEEGLAWYFGTPYLMAAGAGLGALVGSQIKITIPINGKIQNYSKHRKRLEIRRIGREYKKHKRKFIDLTDFLW